MSVERERERERENLETASRERWVPQGEAQTISNQTEKTEQGTDNSINVTIS